MNRTNPLTPIGIYVPEDKQKSITEHYVREVDGAVRLILAADILGLGWSAHGYICPTSDENVTQWEFRVTTWPEIRSETLPWSPNPEAES